MEFEDPATKLAALANQNSALVRFAREAQAQAKMLEMINGPYWMREAQAQAKMLEMVNGPHWMRLASYAHDQMRLFEESNAFKFLKQAQAVAVQFENSNFMRFLRDTETQRRLVELTSGLASVGQSFQRMMAEPGVMKMMREAADTAALYRKFGLDIAQMAAAMPHFAADGMSAATAELEIIEASIGAPLGQRDGEAVTKSFHRLIHTLEGLLDGVRSPIERTAVLKFLSWVIPVILMLWALFAQHEDSVEGQKDSEHNAVIAHLDSENLEKAIEKLAQRYVTAQAQDSHVQYYDVVRLVPLCTERKFNGERHFVLIPGSVVQLMNRRQKWIEVCAVSPSGSTSKGWVLKKYLKRQR